MFSDEDLQNRFLKFMNKYFKEFFSSSHRTPTYNVPHWLAQSMVNEGGKYNVRFKELANRISLANTMNQRANMADTFLTIHEFFGSSLQRVYNELNVLIETWDNYIGRLIDWQIVWYVRYKEIATGNIQA